MVSVYYAFINTAITGKAFDRYFNKLPQDCQKKIMRCRRKEDREASLIGKALLADGLKDRGINDFRLLQLKYDHYGRPLIDGCMEFNIAHSENHVVCALSDTGRVGIDIERIRPLDLTYYLDFFDRGVKAVLLRSENRLLDFFKFWTKIESATKADGRGMNIPATKIKVKNWSALIDDKNWYLHEIAANSAVICHCATEYLFEHIEIKQKSYTS